MKNFVQTGHRVTQVASTLAHPTHSAPNLVLSGDQVVVGGLTGMANTSAAAGTDNVVISTVGVFSLSVIGKGRGGNNVAVAIGDRLYINPNSNGDISKDETQVPFGVALGAVNSGSTTAIPVRLEEGVGGQFQDISVYAADGAIAIKEGRAALTKGTAGAYTLAAPALTDDGKELHIFSESAAAHVITGAVRGFNAKGSSGTLTFGAAKGNAVMLVARGGDWFNLSLIGVTVA